MRIHHPSITALCLALAACSKAPTPGADVAAPAPDAAAVATADAAPVPEDVAPPAPTVVPAELAALPPEASRPDVPLPEGASVRLGAARPFAVRSLHALALAPDGKRLATVSMYESRVTIWSTDTGAIERTLDASPSEHAGDMAFSSDGRLAVIAHDELVLFAPDGAESWRVEPALTGPADNPAFLRAVAFSPDGKLVAVGHNQSAVGLVDAATGKLVRSLKGKGTAFSKVAFSPDGTLVAATGVGDAEHSELRVWSTASGEPALDYAVPSATDDKPFGYAVDLMWLADGRLLTSTSGDALVVWKPGDAAPARASENAISARELAGSTVPFAILLGDQVAVLDPTSFARGSLIAVPGADSVDLIAAAGPLVAVGDDIGVRLLEHHPDGLVDRFPARGHAAAIEGLAWGPDGTWLATGGADATVRIWSATNGREVRVIPVADGAATIRALAVGPGEAGGLVAIATGGRDPLTPTDGALRLVRPDGSEVKSVPIPGGATAVGLSSDGTRVAVGGHDGALVVLDAANGAELARYKHDTIVFDLAWLDAGRLAAALGNEAAIWNVPAGDQPLAGRRAGGGSRDVMRALARAGDADHLATAGYSYGAVSIWDLTKATEEEPKRLGVDGAEDPETIVRALATSPDGKRLAVGDEHGAVRVFDLGAPDAAPRRFAGHSQPVTRVAWSPDGKRLASASVDRTALVWSVP